MAAPPTAEERLHLVGDLIDAFFQAARDLAMAGSEGFIALDEGLSVMSKHARALGYDAVILFLDELVGCRPSWPSRHCCSGNAPP